MPQADRDADWLVAQARVLEARGQRKGAIALYEQALDLDRGNQEATFRLAYLADLEGDDEQAIDYYESLASGGPVHVHALLNLAVLYEDREQYEKAENCIDKVLAIWPEHERARLFLKDILAGRDMIIDEDVERFREKRSALFDIAITDFELSVRARNCLQSMGINTVGDLLRVTEEQLLAYKNFGETSLDEIKNLLTSKGLRLGQALEEERKVRQQEILKQVQGDPAVLVKPVAELQPVRPRSQGAAAAEHPDDRRAGGPHRVGTAGREELRPDQSQRDSSAARRVRSDPPQGVTLPGACTRMSGRNVSASARCSGATPKRRMLAGVLSDAGCSKEGVSDEVPCVRRRPEVP